MHAARRLFDDKSRGANDKIGGVEDADFLICGEISPTVIVAHAEDELVRTFENFIRVLKLDRAANCARARPGTINDAKRQRSEKVGNIG